MDKILSHHITDLQAINKQRKYWLMLSIFVVAVISYIVFDWQALSKNNYFWIFIFSGLTVAVVWWYWTMRIVRIFIQHRQEEVKILHDLVIDIKDIKKNVKDYLT
jgi:uncharacterized membrane protein